MLAQRNGEWAVLAVGGADLIRAIHTTKQSLAAGGHAPAVALVEMHDYGLKLLAQEEAGQVTFTAFGEPIGAGLPVGQRVGAETAFARVAKLARHGHRAGN